MYTLSDFDFNLPSSLIAQHARTKGTSKLLVINDSVFEDNFVSNLASLLNKGDLIVINDTRVLRARLAVQRITGGIGEVLIERISNDSTAIGQFKMSRRPKQGEHLYIKGTKTPLVILDIQDRWITIQSPEMPILQLLEHYGALPLPLYIQRKATDHDNDSYQTIFAKKLGAVAAPTAGLHFTNELIEDLTQHEIHTATITLHVGSGTFLPVKHEDLDQHTMHNEWFDIPENTVNLINETKRRGNKVVAIGTTTLRALEAAALSGAIKAGSAETNIFIRPGFNFKVIDRLFTNFNLPRSTLLMLTSAFGGFENMRKAYEHAIANEYQFFSYGDAMLIDRIDLLST